MRCTCGAHAVHTQCTCGAHARRERGTTRVVQKRAPSSTGSEGHTTTVARAATASAGARMSTGLRPMASVSLPKELESMTSTRAETEPSVPSVVAALAEEPLRISAAGSACGGHAVRMQCAPSAMHTCGAHAVHSTCAITPKQADMRKATAKTTVWGISGWSEAGGGGSGLRRASSAGPARVCVLLGRRRCAQAAPLGCNRLGVDSVPRIPGTAAQQGGIVPIHAVVSIHDAVTPASMAIGSPRISCKFAWGEALEIVLRPREANLSAGIAGGPRC